MKFTIKQDIEICSDCVVSCMCISACEAFQGEVIRRLHMVTLDQMEATSRRDIANLVRQAMIDYPNHIEIICTIGRDVLTNKYKKIVAKRRVINK